MLKALKWKFLGIKSGGDDDLEDITKVNCTKMRTSNFASYVPNGIFGDIRLVFLSDIHCKQYKSGFGIDVTQNNSLTYEEKLKVSIKNLPCGDILIISGDFVETGLVEELGMFNAFLKGIAKEKKFKHIVFICGNHERTIDVDFYNAEGWRYHKTRQDLSACHDALFNELPDNVHYLFDNFIVLEGLKIYGTPWVLGEEVFSSETSPAHFRWAYSVTEEELIQKYEQIPDDVDILVTHMPPFGIGDGRRNYDKDYFDENDKQVFGYDNVGSTSLRSRLQDAQPIIHCFGHIHSGYGAYRAHVDGTLFINAANCDEDYVPIQPAVVVDINSRISTDVILSRIFSKQKLDCAVAIDVAIAYSEISGDDFNIMKGISRCYLKNILTAKFEQYNSSGGLGKASKIRSSLLDLENELAHLLDKYQLLNSIYDSRALSRGALINSPQDYRGLQMVIPHLYIGSAHASESLEMLHSFGITHLCNCCIGWEPIYPNQFSYLSLAIEDDARGDLTNYFMEFICFIDSAIAENRQNNVYVLCPLGISRSAALVLAYLMFTMRIRYQYAMTLLKRARPFVNPSQALVNHLLNFEKSLRISANS